ncbi:uncharacterized protein JCM6883_000642 [Sporobolomyces salmoneus]|uniref:uncharacterized protein n=1 Tax=Sporobolomyces salmoneus TaxID=183962 RepID=UPI003170EFFF
MLTRQGSRVLADRSQATVVLVDSSDDSEHEFYEGFTLPEPKQKTKSTRRKEEEAEQKRIARIRPFPHLPYELICLVLEFAYSKTSGSDSDPPPPPAPPLLSRAFLPLYRSFKHSYQSIEGRKGLNRFNEEVRTVPDFTRTVTSLRMKGFATPAVRSRVHMGGRYHLEDITPEELVEVFKKLDNLKRLELDENLTLILLNELDLSSPPTSPLIPHLRHLTHFELILWSARCARTTRSDSRDLQQNLFKLLELCPSLLSLRLEIGSDSLLITNPTLSFPRIRHLVLIGEVFKDPERGFFEAFPNLHSLEIDDWSGGGIGINTSLAQDRDQLAHHDSKGLDYFPSSLVSLSIRHVRKGFVTSFGGTKSFPRLKHLFLELHKVDQEFMTSLSSNCPNLESIHFGSGTKLGRLELIRSIDTLFDHVSSLERLSLDTESAKIGTLISTSSSSSSSSPGRRAPNFRYSPLHNNPLLVANDWILPDYTFEVGEAFLQASNRWKENNRGIELRGSTFEGMQVLREWREERRRCVEVYLGSREGKKEKFNEWLVSIE